MPDAPGGRPLAAAAAAGADTLVLSRAVGQTAPHFRRVCPASKRASRRSVPLLSTLSVTAHLSTQLSLPLSPSLSLPLSPTLPLSSSRCLPFRPPAPSALLSASSPVHTAEVVRQRSVERNVSVRGTKARAANTTKTTRRGAAPPARSPRVGRWRSEPAKTGWFAAERSGRLTPR